MTPNGSIRSIGVQGWVEHHTARGRAHADADFKDGALPIRWGDTESERIEKRAYIRKFAELLEVDLAPGLQVWDEEGQS